MLDKNIVIIEYKIGSFTSDSVPRFQNDKNHEKRRKGK